MFQEKELDSISKGVAFPNLSHRLISGHCSTGADRVMLLGSTSGTTTLQGMSAHIICAGQQKKKCLELAGVLTITKKKKAHEKGRREKKKHQEGLDEKEGIV